MSSDQRNSSQATISTTDDLPIYLKPDEAAELLRTTRKAIYVKVERRQLPGVKKIGNRILIHARTLLQWIEDQRVAPSLLEKQ
jgi:excisionase family DNA binding protein